MIPVRLKHIARIFCSAAIALLLGISVIADSSEYVFEIIKSKYYEELSEETIAKMQSITSSYGKENYKIELLVDMLDDYSEYYPLESLNLVEPERGKEIYFFYTADEIFIKIYAIDKGVSEQIYEILDNSEKRSVVILDLTECRGGYISEVEKLSQIFVQKGNICTAKFKKSERQYLSNLEKCKYNILVTVSKNTASAAEILASAISQSGTGKIYGSEMTFGKNKIQEIIAIENAGVLKLTVGEYFTRNGTNIGNVGVVPDVWLLEEYQLENISD